MAKKIFFWFIILFWASTGLLSAGQLRFHLVEKNHYHGKLTYKESLPGPGPMVLSVVGGPSFFISIHLSQYLANNFSPNHSNIPHSISGVNYTRKLTWPKYH